MRILGVDPGYKQSAWVLIERSPFVVDVDQSIRLGGAVIVGHAIESNNALLGRLHDKGWRLRMLLNAIVFEQFESYGMTAGREVMETIFWTGRFFEAVNKPYFEAQRLTRRAVKMYLCGNPGAKDSNIRQALIDRFGLSKAQAIGKAKMPGPLYGIKSHEWAALALAVTFLDQHETLFKTVHDRVIHGTNAGHV